MALTWVRIGNLKGPMGPPGDAAATARLNQLETNVATLTANRWLRGMLPANSNYRELANGVYYVATASTANSFNPPLPFGAAGKLEVSPGENYGRIVEFSTFGSSSRPNQVWQIERSSTGVWGEWSQTNAALPMKHALTGSQVLADLTPGYYWITSLAIAQLIADKNPGFPSPASGHYIVHPGGYGRHEWITTGLNSRPNEKWQMEKRGDGTWTDWWRTDARAAAVNTPISGPSIAGGSTASGFKVVPVTLTRDGNGGASVTTRTSRSERLRHVCTAPGARFRVHIQNANLRDNMKIPGALAMNGLWWGRHAGNGNYSAAPQRLAGAFTTPATGDEWVSPWFNIAQEAGAEYLLSFGFTAAEGQQFAYHIGQSYASEDPAYAGEQQHLGAGNAKSILDVWIEVETYATTPVIATIGSSTPTGVGADWPVQESVVSRVAEKLKALPMHYGGSGDTMANSANFGWERWTRWAGLAKPDAVLMMQHTNDVFEAGMTLATLQSRYNTLMTYLRQNISPNIYVTTVTPRTNVTGPQEDLRRQFNTWLRTLPGGARDCFELGVAVSTDDETLLPAFDSGDGYHLSPAGHAAMAAAINRPITTPPVMYAA